MQRSQRTQRGKAAKKPKAMGHGTHGFSRIKQSNCKWKSEESNPSSLNKNLVKKTKFFGLVVQRKAKGVGVPPLNIPLCAPRALRLSFL
jgi:hypothetical protein